MPALFPEWSNTAIRLALLALALGVVGLPAALMLYARTPYFTGQGAAVAQPVEFDHRHHVADDGIDCRYCHDTVERAAFAGMPATELCMNCHSQVWRESRLLAPVRASLTSGTPIPWRRVYRLPDHVYFNHAIHVTRGIGCVTCHGRVDRMAQVVQVPPLSMSWCLACHRAPERHLRPRDQITAMTWAPAGDPQALAAALSREYGTRRLTSCTTCHR